MADHVTALQKFEEDRRISESKMFAIADYESLNFEWKSVKKDNEARYLEKKKAGDMEVFADEIYVIHRYIIDKKFTIKMAEKLTEVALVLPDFKSAAEFYLNLHALLTAELNKMDNGGLFTRKPSRGFSLDPPRLENDRTETQNALQKAVEDAKQRAVVALERLCRPEDLEKLNKSIQSKKSSENKILENIYRGNGNNSDTSSVADQKLSANEVKNEGISGDAFLEEQSSSAEEEPLHKDPDASNDRVASDVEAVIVPAVTELLSSDHVADSSLAEEYMGHLKVSEVSDETVTVPTISTEQEIPLTAVDGSAPISDAMKEVEPEASAEDLTSPSEDTPIEIPMIAEAPPTAASDDANAPGVVAIVEDSSDLVSETPSNIEANTPALQPDNNGDLVIVDDAIQNEQNNAEEIIAVPPNDVAAVAPENNPNNDNNGIVLVNNNPAPLPANRPRLRVNFVGLGNDAQNVDLSFIHLICVFMYIFMFAFVLIVIPVYLGRFIFNSYLLSDLMKQNVKDLVRILKFLICFFIHRSCVLSAVAEAVA